ncbi:MAG: tetratricopeptide repeat protein [Spirulina sp.]
MTQIRQYLDNPKVKLIGIDGVGGVGKSTLATKIFCEEVEESKRYWADVSTGKNFAEFAQSVLTKFGAYIPDEKELVTALIRCLQGGHYFLVVDNLESLLRGEDRQWNSLFYGEFFGQWIEKGWNSKILVTTREQPDLRGFNRHWISLKGLKVEEGAQLLSDLGICGDLAAFSRLVDGHPLLLRLVADFLIDEFPQDPNLERFPALAELRALLKNPQIKGQHRRQEVAIQFVFDESFNRLSEIQKELFLNASVYRGEFDAEMAQAVLPAREECDREKIEAELKKLIKRSLLEAKLGEKYFFEFQPVILEYVRGKAGEQTETHHRAIDYYRSRFKPVQTKEDIKEYQEVVYHYFKLGNYETAFDTIRSIDKFLTLQGLSSIRIELYEPLARVWQQANVKENWKYTASLIDLGNAYDSLGDYEKTIDYYQQSLTIAREIGDRSGEGGSLCNIGNTYHTLGQYQKALEYYEQAFIILESIKHREFIANTLTGLGNVYGSLGDYQKAIDYHKQSLTIAKEMGSRSGESSSLGGLGSVYSSLGDYEKAIDYHHQSLNIAREIGDRSEEENSLKNLGIAYNSLGQHQKAIDYQKQSLTIAREIGDRSGEEKSLGSLGSIYSSLGEYEKSIDYYQQSLTIARELGALSGEGGSLCNLGHTYYSLKQYQKAIEYYEQALIVLQPIKHRKFISNTLTGLGNTYQSLGDYQKAIDYQQQSLTIAREIGDRSGEGKSLGNLGNAYAALKQSLKAIEYHEKSLIIKREIGDRRSEIHSLQSLGILYQQVGRIQEGFAANNQAIAIARELELPLEVKPYPNWYKSLIRFAQRSNLHLMLCFILGFIAFPFALIVIILSYLIVLIRAPLYRK